MPCGNANHKEENNINGRTKPKIIGISALLIAALLSGVVFASAVSEDGSKISDGAINDIELAWRDDLQDIYHRYNVSEDNVLFIKNDRPHYLNRTILDKDTVVIATGTGEPPDELKEGEDCEIVISKGDRCMIWAQGKSLSTENLMQHREVLTDTFFKRSGGKLSNRYVGMSEDLKVSEDTKLVAYGFRIRPDGVTEEYGGYCGQDFSGYTEAIKKTERWFSTLYKETSDGKVVLNDQQWSLIDTCTEAHIFPPHGDYDTVTYLYWDDVETVPDKDYFMLKSQFRMMPGNQQYGNDWCNHRGYIHHDWKYYDYPGTRDMLDAQPYDESGETTISITLSGISVSSTWLTIIPDYELDSQCDGIKDVAKWEEKINPYSPTCGGSELTVQPGSTMYCSQYEARSGEWIGLVLFKSKPEWMNLDPYNFGGSFSSGYWGYANCVRWTGSEYTGTDGMEGDVSGDGHVTIGDAMLIAQHTTHIITLDADQLKCADTTDEGSVTIGDAMHIAQYTVDPNGSLGVLFKPIWESPADDDMLKPVP